MKRASISLFSVYVHIYIFYTIFIKREILKFHRMYDALVGVVVVVQRTFYAKAFCINFYVVFFCHSLLFWHNDGNNNNIIFFYGLLANIWDSIKIQWMLGRMFVVVWQILVFCFLVNYGKKFTLLFLFPCCLSFLHGLQLNIFFGTGIFSRFLEQFSFFVVA